MVVALAIAAQIEESDQDEQELLDALEAVGVPATTAVWDDPSVDWGDYEAVIVRSTWDYVDKYPQYLAWIDRTADVTRLFNPSDVLRWNTHKGYLMELEDRGVPIVPTAWLGRGDQIDLAKLAADRGWNDLVVKPAVGAGASGLFRVRADISAGQKRLDKLLATDDVMVQPFQNAIAEHGELSIVCVDGTFSHAVRKRARPGDMRIQIEFGGSYVREEPDEPTRRLAEWIVASTGHELLYARVDLVPDDDGSWQLGELELTEPSLYLTWAPDGAARLATAIRDRVQ